MRITYVWSLNFEFFQKINPKSTGATFLFQLISSVAINIAYCILCSIYLQIIFILIGTPCIFCPAILSKIGTVRKFDKKMCKSICVRICRCFFYKVFFFYICFSSSFDMNLSATGLEPTTT